MALILIQSHAMTYLEYWGGLQYIYVTRNIREGIFNLLESRMLENVNMNTGRPGMSLWKIFVLGVLRLDLNCDYDRLCELANNHKTIRQMLGHSDIFDNQSYNLQTLKDNVRLLKPELLEEINQIIVKAGHQLLSTKKETNHCEVVVIHLFLKPMFIFLQI